MESPLWRNLVERLAELPYLLGGHLLLSTTAILVGVCISVPLGILVARRQKLAGPVLLVASLVQTIPSLALLALMVPLLGGMIGFLPAFLALTLYSLLPTLRNTVTGLREIDPELIEAARAVGMTERQSLWRVQLPLALPVMIAGVRTGAVWVIGTTTLSTPVGAPSLGNYIFAGLQTRNWVSVIFGCFFAALLAIVIDRMIHLLERSAAQRDWRLTYWAGGMLGVVLFLGLAGPLFSLFTSSGGTGPRGPETSAHEERPEPAVGAAGESLPLQGTRVRVGAKTFTEQYILAELIELRLKAGGAQVETLQNLGSTIVFDALENNTVDLYVDYTGTIWTTIMKREQPLSRISTWIRMAAYLEREKGILTLGRLGFENAYCLAMRRDRARELGIRSARDLGRLAGSLTLGGDPEFFGRPEWIRVREAYGLEGMTTRSMDSTFMYGAVRDGQVDLIGAYTTDGRIAAYDLLILDDPEEAFPPYDAVLLLAPGASHRTALLNWLEPILNRIDDDLMREANRRVDLEGESPAAAARFLADRIGW